MATGLIRRNGRYSTRRVIPLDLQASYGRREIVRAGTADPAETKRLHARTWVALNDEFDAARAAALAKSQTRQPAAPTQRAPDPWETMSDAEFRFEMEQLELRDADTAREERAFEAREALREQLEARLSITGARRKSRRLERWRPMRAPSRLTTAERRI